METRPKTTKKEEKERQGKTSKGREWFVWFGGEFTLFVLLFLLLCLGLLFWGEKFRWVWWIPTCLSGSMRSIQAQQKADTPNRNKKNKKQESERAEEEEKQQIQPPSAPPIRPLTLAHSTDSLQRHASHHRRGNHSPRGRAKWHQHPAEA